MIDSSNITLAEHTLSRKFSKPLLLASICVSLSAKGRFPGNLGKMKSLNWRFSCVSLEGGVVRKCMCYVRYDSTVLRVNLHEAY